jgi:hypothetical protein
VVDKKELEGEAKDVFELAEAPPKRPFLGANARTADGTALFPKVGHVLVLKCTDVDTFTKNTIAQPALILQDESATEYILPLNKTNQYALSRLGFKNIRDIVGRMVAFKSYDTGSDGAFKYGLEITAVTAPQKR